MNSQGIILLVVGVFTLVMTIKKPDFYWESRKAKNLRWILGDKWTTIFYIALACFMLFFGFKLTF